jgi:hypothetical protein
MGRGCGVVDDGRIQRGLHRRVLRDLAGGLAGGNNAAATPRRTGARVGATRVELRASEGPIEAVQFLVGQEASVRRPGQEPVDYAVPSAE